MKTRTPLRTFLERVRFSSLHFAIASVNEAGWPHITPIGSFMLLNEQQGIYFEKFTTQMPKNFSHSDKICVLGVNSTWFFWAVSLILGRFTDYPAIRMYGTVGKRRKATPEETRMFEKRLGIYRFLKGGKTLWQNMAFVREVHLDRIDPVKVGTMTAHLNG